MKRELHPNLNIKNKDDYLNFIRSGIGNSIWRSTSIRSDKADKDEKTVPLTFSSNALIDRGFGYEVLSHDPKHIRDDRLQMMNLLMDHDHTDVVGGISDVVFKDGLGKANARFSKSQRGMEIFQDVVDGIRKGISVGYRVFDVDDSEIAPDGRPIFNVIDWMPYEVTLTSVPVDVSVGTFRSLIPSKKHFYLEGKNPLDDTKKKKDEVRKMPEEIKERIVYKDPTNEQLEGIRNDALKNFQKRASDILAISESFPDLKDKCHEWIRSDLSIQEIQNLALVEIGKSHNLGPESKRANAGDGRIGMNEKEVKRYSLCRAILGQLNNSGFGDIDDSFEREVSSEYRRRTGHRAKGFSIPPDVLFDGNWGPDRKRAMTVGTATSGGHTVETVLEDGEFVDFLRKRLFLRKLGARVMDGLQGNVDISRKTGVPTVSWGAEGIAGSESQSAFDLISMSPNRLSAWTEYSIRLLVQSSRDVELEARNDLLDSAAEEIDRVAIHGSGSGSQPAGLETISGVNEVAINANGGPPTWDHIIDMETQIGTANADVMNMVYVFNSKGRGKLKRTQKFSGTNGDPIYEFNPFTREFGLVNGYNAAVSNIVRGDISKGTGTNLSAGFFGDWTKCIIALWGAIDVIVNPYSKDKEGMIRVTVQKECDVNFKHLTAFTRILDMDTA